MVGFDLNLKPLVAHLAELEARAKNLKKPIAEIGEKALEENARTFAAQGPGWPAAVYRSKPKGTPILVKTGRLKNSLTVKGAPGNIFRATDGTGEFGTRVPYADRLQRGGTMRVPKGKKVPGKRRKWTKAQLPARPIIKEPTPAFRSAIDLSLVSHLDFEVKQGSR